MSQAMRMLNPSIAKTRTCLIFINQLRSKVGVMFGNPETTSGGNALKYYASVRLDIRKLQGIKDGEETVGSRVKVKVVKNKVAPPFKIAELDLMHDKGISWEGDLIDLAIEDKFIDKSGAWFSCGEVRLGQGRENVKQYLRDNPALVEEIRTKVLDRRGLLRPAAGAVSDGEAEPAKPEPPAKEPTRRERKSAAAAPASE
jgi:recombination protein RecA